jgi:bifunctional aromatase (cyclase/dehydratase)
MTAPVAMEDMFAVQDLLGRYCWHLDEGRGEAWADLYTDDGIFEGTRPEPVCGRAALSRVPPELRERTRGKMRHLYGNLYVEQGPDANTLIARFYNQLSNWADGGKLFMLALSTATLVRSAPGEPWRIQRNSIVFP